MHRAGLPEHRDALRRTESAVEKRVRQILEYARSVQRLDRTLADIDASIKTRLLDDRLRDTLAELDNDTPLTALTTESRAARTFAKAAIEALQRQTDMLRTTDNLS